VGVLAIAPMGCARAIFVPPAGPGAPAADAATAWAQATAACRDVKSYVGALGLSGKVGSQRIWRVSIESAVTAAREIYLGATVSGRPVFLLAGTDERATLWLRGDDDRAVTAPAADIVEALIGVRLDARRVLAVLSGCATLTPDVDTGVARQVGRLVRVATGDGAVYLEKRTERWTTRAAEVDGETDEYAWKEGPYPADVWFWSDPKSPPPAASLHLSVNDLRVNDPVPASFFRPSEGALRATPMTIEELRKAGPLRERASGEPGS